MKGKGKGVLIFILLAVVAVALVLVFVFLFKDKNTKGYAKDLNEATTQGYLYEDSNEYKTIMGYLSTVTIDRYLGTGTEDANEAANYMSAYAAYAKIAVFFNNEAPYMEHTKTYSKNRSKIVKKINAAQKAAKKLVEKINNYSETTGGSMSWQRVVWNNSREEFQDLIDNTISAFKLMENVYTASVKSNLMNNDLSVLLFKAIDYLNDGLQENAKITTNAGAQLFNFANVVFMDDKIETAILNYTYSTTRKGAVEEILEKGETATEWNEVLSGSIFMAFV